MESSLVHLAIFCDKLERIFVCEHDQSCAPMVMGQPIDCDTEGPRCIVEERLTKRSDLHCCGGLRYVAEKSMWAGLWEEELQLATAMAMAMAMSIIARDMGASKLLGASSAVQARLS